MTENPATHGTSATSIAFMVGTLNRIDQLKLLVDSIRRNVGTQWELHVCDAGSTDGTRAWLAEQAERDIRILPVFEEERAGQAAALNGVLARVSADFVCWLSDDNVVKGDGVDVAVAALSADEKLGMVGLKVKDRRGPFEKASYIGGITSTGIININQGVLGTPLFQALGGFSREFRDYGIDADLTTRVLLAGYDVAMTRSVAVEHFRNWPQPGSPQARWHDERNVAYRAHYDALYRNRIRSGLGWMARRALWKSLRLLAPEKLSPEAGGTLLGRPVRDWHNILAGQFIRMHDEITDRDTPLHLRQHAPTRKR